MKIPSLRSGFATFLLVVCLAGCKDDAVVTTSLPRSTPEAEGVSSDAVISFLDSAAAGKHEFHSFMFLRHGKVIAEGWWSPYGPELKHTLYSLSKSFTSTAVGFAVTEKRLTVEDKVISFFPGQMPDTISPFLADMKIKDLLTMSVGQSPEPTGIVSSPDTDWVRSFLAIPVEKEPGSVFLYNSVATFMLSAIVQKVTGEKVIDYLMPRLFEPLGIFGMDWEENPQGINTGGWGLRLKTEDMAKFGQFCLQKGKWNGKEVIPAAWVEEATTFKIDQAPDAPQSKKDSNDWMQGYCYQFWRCRHNAFRGDGAYGQYIIVFPDKDAVVAITSETEDMQGELDLIWQYLLPALKDENLPENTEAAELLKKKLSTLALPVPEKKTDSPVAQDISSNPFILTENVLGLDTLMLEFKGENCILSLKAGNIASSFSLGRGQWIYGETDFPQINYLSKPGSLKNNKIAGSYSWKDKNTIELVIRYIENAHKTRITCGFSNGVADVYFHFSMPPGIDIPVIRGKMVK